MKNVLANFTSQAWVALMGIVFVPVYIRFLGDEAYGLIGFFTVMSIFLHTISMGIVPALTREMTQIYIKGRRQQEILDLKSTIELIAILLAVCIAAIFALMSNKIATDWLRPENIDIETVNTSVQIMGAILAIRLIEAIYRSILIGMGQISTFAKITAAMATIRGVGAIVVLYLFNSSIIAFFAWNFATTIVTIAVQKMIVSTALSHFELKGRFRISAIFRIGNFAVGMMLVTITGSLYSQVDKFILSSLLPLSEYGMYTIASTLAATILMTVSPLTQAIFPELSKLFFERKERDFRELYVWSARLVVILTTSFGSVLALNSEKILEIWTGNSAIENETAFVFAVLCISFVVNGLSWIPQQAQFSVGNTKTTIKLNSVLAVFLTILLFPATAFYGTPACAILLLLANLIYITAYLIMAKREFIQRGFSEFILLDITFPALACVACVALWKIFFINIPLDVFIVYQIGIEGVSTVILLLISYRYITRKHLKWLRLL